MGLKEIRRRWTARTDELHSASLQERYAGLGEAPMANAPVRIPVRLVGEVTRHRIVPRAGSPVLELTVSDGTGEIVTIFTGRLTLGGLGHGRGVEIHGVPYVERGRTVMLNPEYRLLG